MVDKQAYLLSYLDSFRVVSVFFIAILPLIFLLVKRRNQTQLSAAEAADAAKVAAEAH